LFGGYFFGGLLQPLDVLDAVYGEAAQAVGVVAPGFQLPVVAVVLEGEALWQGVY